MHGGMIQFIFFFDKAINSDKPCVIKITSLHELCVQFYTRLNIYNDFFFGLFENDAFTNYIAYGRTTTNERNFVSHVSLFLRFVVLVGTSDVCILSSCM